MRRALQSDVADIAVCLGVTPERAMFPLNNLARYGLDGTAEWAPRMWIAGGITDVLTLTMGGMVMPFLPGTNYAAAAAVITGQNVTGITGPRDMARGMEQALGLTNAPRTLDHDEPQFLLDLAGMTVPDGPGRIVPLADAPAVVVRSWMLDYQLSTLNTPAGQAQQRVDQSYAAYRARGSHVVLMDAGVPLAMTGFNAQLPDIVQIGGVYTPPAMRGRGHARRALALHLAQAQAAGVTRATLFSASDMAARAYQAIGFVRIGTWTLLLFDGPQVAHG
jgi:RimJ/RimL family protein N-acetyltransferase